MSKDPAMLWYWNDWHSGTILMSRFLKGCYIDILHAQFNNGRLSLSEVKTILGSDFGQSWPILQKKFKQDELGLFFNERLEREKEKRMKFSESRRSNRLKITYDKTYDKDTEEHMKTHMENRNGNGNSFFDEEENKKHSLMHCSEVAMRHKNWVDLNKTTPYELEMFNRYLERTGEEKKTFKDYKKHFSNFKAKFPDKLKKELTIEELHEIAKSIDSKNKKQ